MPTTKEQVEKVFRSVGVKPVLRENLQGYDFFVGDGFSRPPHFRWQSRMEIQPGEYPMGAYVTFWWLGKDEKLLIGHPLFFDWMEVNQTARIAAARNDALKEIKRRRKSNGAIRR
jgi:hypothetical protein